MKVLIVLVFFLIITFSMLALIVIRVRTYSKKYIISMDDLPSDIKIIIVLGAGVRSDGTPCDILFDRLETSVEVFKKNNDGIFILSGDHSGKEYNEVRAMKNCVLKHDIDEKKIFMDHAGFSTYETMYRAKNIFNVDKAIIVTNEYHLPRAIYIARKLGIYSYGVKSDKRGYMLMDKYKKREVVAQLKDFIYVNILRRKSKILGDSIPIYKSDGRITDDEINL